MKDQSNVIDRTRIAGPALAALGVLGFSLTLPTTKLAVEGLDPWFVAFGRAVGAAALAAAYLRFTAAPRPDGVQLRRLVVVACGVVIGFPLGTSLALRSQTSSHGAVVVTLLPAATATVAALRLRERPPPAFWWASLAGLAAVLTFVVLGGGLGGPPAGSDLLLLASVGLCAVGYAEGGALARELGGARTICWALVVALPVTAPVTVSAALTTDVGQARLPAWLGFAYVTTVSMFLGFIAWYAGLARGGVARASQVQLVQPVLTLGWSAFLLGEHVGAATLLAAVAVLACVVATQRTRWPTTRVVLTR